MQWPAGDIKINFVKILYADENVVIELAVPHNIGNNLLAVPQNIRNDLNLKHIQPSNHPHIRSREHRNKTIKHESEGVENVHKERIGGGVGALYLRAINKKKSTKRGMATARRPGSGVGKAWRPLEPSLCN